QSTETSPRRGSFGRRGGKADPAPEAPAHPDEPEWRLFCDFREITHVALRESRITIHRQDNKCLEAELPSPGLALALVALLDGYFRLTADSSHYLCPDVAPPRLLDSIRLGIHGPMQEEFVFAKLRREEPEEGLYIIRWSVLDFDRIILSVAKRSHRQVGGRRLPARNSREFPGNGTNLPALFQALPGAPGAFAFRQFRIQKKGDSFALEGWEREFPSLRELLDVLQGCTLRSGQENFAVRRCCPPRPGEISDLLIARQAKDNGKRILNLTQLSFHRIRKDEITQVLLFPGIGAARLSRDSGGLWEDLLGFPGIQGGCGRTCLAFLGFRGVAFFEAASLMSQVSHVHLAFVHGVCVRGSENILVEEFVEHGPLDVLLRKEKGRISVGWKIAVAKQLGSALSYLVMGALFQPGILTGAASPPLLPHPGSLTLGKEDFFGGDGARGGSKSQTPSSVGSVSEPGKAVDGEGNSEQGLGNGAGGSSPCFCSPLRVYPGAKSREKERFYEQRGRLPEPSCRDLGSLLSQCLRYNPGERPSFRTILRDLTQFQP
ncbi:TYK2 kinase, partial [Mionectes macconnelli]|nr:TYK2 kinase [Mionectes macconnelli]